MIPRKSIGNRLTILFLSLFVFSIVNTSAQGDVAAGKALFLGKCAACHNVFKDMTGPALGGMEERGKWADHNELLKWINNPAGYMAADAYTPVSYTHLDVYKRQVVHIPPYFINLCICQGVK